MRETRQVALKVRVKGAIVSFLLSGNIILLIFGVAFSAWLNNLFATPIPVLLLGLLPFSIFTVQNLIIPFCLFLFGILIVWKLFKSTNYNGFSLVQA